MKVAVQTGRYLPMFRNSRLLHLQGLIRKRTRRTWSGYVVDREPSMPECTDGSKEILKDSDGLQKPSFTTTGMKEKWLGVTDGRYMAVKRDSVRKQWPPKGLFRR
jgi:hypothetical protein